MTTTANPERDTARRLMARKMALTIVAAITRKDISMAEIDKRIGRSSGYIRAQLTAMEAGTATVSLETIANIVWALDIAFQWRILDKVPRSQTIQIVPVAMPGNGPPAP